MDFKQVTIVADFGNSSCKLARMNHGQIEGVVSIPYDVTLLDQDAKSRLIGELSLTLTSASSILAISVVSEAQQDKIMALLKQILKRPLTLFILPMGALREAIQTEYPLDQLGADRLVNIIAATQRDASKPVIVVDVGTATTLDVYEPVKGYVGGLIVPGLRTYWNTLNRTTAKLPAPEIKACLQAIGSNTETSIQRGVGLGYVAMMQALVSDLAKEASDTPEAVPVVWTGGSAQQLLDLAEKLGRPLPCEYHDQYLTLRGVYQVACLPA